MFQLLYTLHRCICSEAVRTLGGVDSTFSVTGKQGAISQLSGPCIGICTLFAVKIRDEVLKVFSRVSVMLGADPIRQVLNTLAANCFQRVHAGDLEASPFQSRL